MKRLLLLAAALLCALPAAAQTPVASRAGIWYSRTSAYSIGAGVYSCPNGNEICLGVPPLTAGGTGNSSWSGAANRIVRINSGGTLMQASELSVFAGILTFPGALSGSSNLAASNIATGTLVLPALTARLVAGPNSLMTDDAILRWDGTGGLVSSPGTLLRDDGALQFGTGVTDKLRLWGNVYGAGIEAQTMTLWADDRFRFRLQNVACEAGDTCRTAGDEIASLTAAGLRVGVAGTPSAMLHGVQPILGTAVLRLESAATGDDPALTVHQARGATTTATTATMFNTSIASATVVMIEAHVIAHCTGGASCSADAGAGYVLRGTYKNSGGTVTLIGALTAEVNETTAGWDATLTIAGTLVNLNVTGAATTDITWHADIEVRRVGT